MATEPRYTQLTSQEELLVAPIIYVGRKYGSSRLRKLNNKNLSDEERHDLFMEIYDKASLQVTGMKYNELSPALRSEISRRHALMSDFRIRDKDTLGPAEESMVAEVSPKKKKPRSQPPMSMYRQAFRQQVLRHSWWYLELHDK